MNTLTTLTNLITNTNLTTIIGLILVALTCIATVGVAAAYILQQVVALIGFIRSRHNTTTTHYIRPDMIHMSFTAKEFKALVAQHEVNNIHLWLAVDAHDHACYIARSNHLQTNR